MALRDGYVSLRAFAREHDCRLWAVQKAIKSGRVTEGCVLRNERGFVVGIHAVNAWVEWLRNTDQGEGVKSGMEYPAAVCSAHASTPLIDSAPALIGGQSSIEQAPAASLPVGEVRGASAPLPDGLAVLPPALPGAVGGAGKEQPPDRGHCSAALGVSHNAAADELPLGAVTHGAAAAAPALADGEPGFQEHRTKREKFLAEQAELDYLAKIGALVSVAEVDRATSEIFSELKSIVFRIVPKKSAILAAETDPGRIERLLMDALTLAFNESSLAFADHAAGGVEERAGVMS